MKSLVLLSIAAVIWFSPETATMQGATSRSYDLADDPPVGLQYRDLSLPSLDVRGRAVPAIVGHDMVVQGGTCTSCSLKAVSFAKLPVTEFDWIVVFYQATAKEVAESTASSVVPRNEFLVADASSKAQIALNASWTGRWYVFHGGRLSNLQRRVNMSNWGD